MEEWSDQAVILSARPHGEGGAIVNLLTSTRGRRAGYVYGAHKGAIRAAIEIGTLVDVRWRGSSVEQLGTLTVDSLRAHAALLAHDPWRLKALQAACALCEAALPERERQEGVFEGLVSLLHILTDFSGDDSWALWPAAYVFWEIGLLGVLGFALDLEMCAGGGDSRHLTHVSPKTGRAVSREIAEPYKDKLLVLPSFLTPQRDQPTPADMAQGLRLTHYFLEHKVFSQHTQGMPQARRALQHWCKEEV